MHLIVAHMSLIVAHMRLTVAHMRLTVAHMSLIHNEFKSKNGGNIWGTFVQKVIKEEVIHYVRGEEISVYLLRSV